MNKTKKTNIVIIAILLVGVLIVANLLIFNVKIIEDNKELVIGAVLPLSGDFAFIGEEIQNGMKLAQENSDLSIRIIFEDDQFSSAVSVNAANKLINIDNIDIGLTSFVEEAKPIAPIFENSKTPLVVVWDSTEFIKESDFLFSTGFSTELAGEKMAEYAYEDLGLSKIAIVSHNEPWSELISESFANRFQELGGEIVLHNKHNLEDNDFRSTITKIKNVDVEGVYMTLLAPTSINFLVQAKEMNLDKQVLSADALIQDVIDASEDASEGIIFTNIYSEDTESLRKKYIQKFGKEPIDMTIVSFGFNGLNAIINAHKENAQDLQLGLVKVISSTGSLDKEERIFQVKDGHQILITN